MKLDALYISDYAAVNLDAFKATGAVHSVFRTSLNVMLDGFLLHIGSAEAPLSCLGITVAEQGASALVNLVEPGDRAMARNGVLRLYGRGDVVEIDLISAPIRCLSVPMATVAPEGETDILVCRELSELSLPARIGLPWDERAARSLAGLARLSAVSRAAWDAERSSASAPAERIEAAYRDMCSAVEYLMGRGLGLTPSGDDVLMGFGTGLRYLYGSRAEGPACHFFEEVARVLPGKTTAVSEAYLRAMCDGHANEDYIDLIGALESRDRAELDSSINRVLSVGHTSGADGMLGFAAAFCCLV